MDFKDIIGLNNSNIAFIIGNGINRYPDNPPEISWEGLLDRLYKKFSSRTSSEIPKGISTTEFYDLLDIENITDGRIDFKIKKEVCLILKDWSFHLHHKNIVTYARDFNIPVLTTNFDLIFPKHLA